MTNVVTVQSNQVASVGSGSAASPLKVVAGNKDTIIAGDYVWLTAGSNDVITFGDYGVIVAGNRSDGTASDNNLMIVGNHNTISAGDNDTISAGNNNMITMGSGVLSANNNNTVTLDAGATLQINSLGNSNVLHDGSAIVNGKLVGGGNTITFGAGESVTLYGTGDTLNAGRRDVITIGGDGGSNPTRSIFTIGSGTSGATINGGLGIDTFSPGTGYVGGNTYIGSYRGFSDGFNAIGSCINYTSTADAAGAATRVVVDLNAGVGHGYNSSGSLLWTDTFSNIQQVKASAANGNILTGSDAFYCELKGAGGSTTYYGGGAGDRIIWSSADGNGVAGGGMGLDVAYAGTGTDEFYWRDQPKGKGLSNMGETIYKFSAAIDTLNFSEFTTVAAPFANASGRNFDATKGSDGRVADLNNWVSVALDGNGNTTVLFDKFGDGTTNSQHFQTAAVLKGVDLFAAYGVSPTSGGAAQQVVQDMYAFNGHSALVLNQTH